MLASHVISLALLLSDTGSRGSDAEVLTFFLGASSWVCLPVSILLLGISLLYFRSRLSSNAAGAKAAPPEPDDVGLLATDEAMVRSDCEKDSYAASAERSDAPRSE